MLFKVIIVLSLFPVVLSAQTGQIKYRIKIPNSSGHYMHDIPGYLYFERERHFFVFDRKQDKEPYEGTPDSRLARYRDEYGQMFYFDKNTNTLFFRVFFWIYPYVSNEEIPKLFWQLYPDTKVIANMLCKKAETAFRGRKYIAWYTTSIPVSAGPWKLHGLPGVILEAESEDEKVKFIAESIVFPSDVSENIPKDIKDKLSVKESIPGEYLSFEEFKKVRATTSKKVDDFFNYTVLTAIENMQKERKEEIQKPKIISKTDLFSIELNYD